MTVKKPFTSETKDTVRAEIEQNDGRIASENVLKLDMELLREGVQKHTECFFEVEFPPPPDPAEMQEALEELGVDTHG